MRVAKIYSVSEDSSRAMLEDILAMLTIRVNDSILLQKVGEQIFLERLTLVEKRPTKNRKISFKARVEAWMRLRLKNGLPVSAAEIAQDLRVSRTTLHRHLRMEAVTYQVVLDQIRCGIAREMINNPMRKPTLKELTTKLGFRSRSASYKALRRWRI